jgi:hypothetical protein
MRARVVLALTMGALAVVLLGMLNWRRAVFRPPLLSWSMSTRTHLLWVQAGSVEVLHVDVNDPRLPSLLNGRARMGAIGRQDLGIIYFARPTSTDPDYSPEQTVVPLWILVLILLIYPVGVGMTRVARRWMNVARLNRHLCIKCSYSLRGLTEPRCPECGTPFEMNSNSTAVSGEAERRQPDATP